MRICSKIVVIFSVLMLFACQDQVYKSETVVRRGVLYKLGDKKPFTGIVEGRGREGYRSQICKYRKQYKNGVLDGVSKYWYSNGKLESEEPYKNGQINGIIIRYYNNGQKKARIPIKNGMRGGSTGELFWDKNGKLLRG